MWGSNPRLAESPVSGLLTRSGSGSGQGVRLDPNDLAVEIGVIMAVTSSACVVFIDLAAGGGGSSTWTDAFNAIDGLFVLGFACEQAVKLRWWGFAYLRSSVLNVVDGLVVLISLVQLGIRLLQAAPPLETPALKLLRLLRLSRLITSSMPGTSGPAAFARQDAALQSSCFCLFLCAGAIALATGDSTLAKILGGLLVRLGQRSNRDRMHPDSVGW